MKTYVFLPDMPLWIIGMFMGSVGFTLWAWYKASVWPRAFWGYVMLWISLQWGLGATGFYLSMNSTPPRFLALIGPPLVGIGVLLFSQRGKALVTRFDVRTLLWLHVVRVPVEITLWMLHQKGYIPESMTWSGRNWDIISGLSAPLVWFWGYQKPILSRWALQLWHIVCLFLLVNIVLTAVLAAPTPFQLFDVQQPNVGVFAFPFLYLPAVIVPLVLASHLIALRQSINGAVRE